MLDDGAGELLGVPDGLDAPVPTGEAWELDGAGADPVGLAVPVDGVGDDVAEAPACGEAVPRVPGLALAASVAAVSRARTGDVPPSWAAVVWVEHGFVVFPAVWELMRNALTMPDDRMETAATATSP